MGLRSYIENSDAAYNWRFASKIGMSHQKQSCEQTRINPMSTYPFHSVRPLTRALSSLVLILVLVIGFSLAAYGANPAEEMAKVGTTDPKAIHGRRFSTASSSSRIRNSCCDSSLASAWLWPVRGPSRGIRAVPP